MSDIADWLDGIGLGKYAETFRENEIDLDTLAYLSDQDLIDLGLPLGPRRKIQSLVAEREKASMPAPVAEEHGQPPRATGGRRQVTVVFADIAGYTKLSNELDAEVIHDLLNRYFEVVDGIIHHYGGTIDKHIGDAVMAVFGAPVAHTDDPERAVRAAMDIHGAMEGLSTELGLRLAVHIGIASGTVVAGGTGSQAHSEYTMTGDTVNLASRLDGLAEAGQTLLSNRVREAVAHVARCSFHGAVQVKGFADPVEVWAVDGLAPQGETEEVGGFIGRRAELDQFAALLAAMADRGTGQAVLLRGEAGLGKSRLAGEFARLAREQDHHIAKGLVLDFGVRRGQDAVGGILRGLLDIGMDSREDDRQQAIDRAIATGLVAESHRTHMLDLLDLPQPPDLKLLFDAMGHDHRLDGARDALAQLLRARSTEAPLLILVEDIHWADETTAGHLAAMASAAVAAPILLLMTSRPEGRGVALGWLMGARDCPLTTIELRPLGDTEARQLATLAARVDPRLLEDCIARSQGNPLFLTQLLRSLKESGGKALPDSIQSVVLARMDRLAPLDREALQCAAVLGQRFPLDALRGVLGRNDYDPAPLIADQLIQPEGDRYLFGHALIRDGAYSSLLRQHRTDLHRRAADFFRISDPVLVAEHLAAAADAGAAEAYLEAARAEHLRYRHDPALDLIEKGLKLDMAAATRFELLSLKTDLEQIVGHIGPATESGQKAIQAAHDPVTLCRAHLDMAGCYRLLTEYEEAFHHVDRAAEALGDTEDPLVRSRLHHLRGNLYFPTNDLVNCRNSHLKALEYALAAGSPRAEAMARGGLGDVAYIEGQVAEGIAHFSAALELCRTHGFGREAMAFENMIGDFELFRLNLPLALEMLGSVRDQARQVRYLRGQMLALAGHSMVYGVTGQWHRQNTIIGEFNRIREQLKMSGWQDMGLRIEAQGLYALGQKARAREQAALALRIAKETGSRFSTLWSIGTNILLCDDAQQGRDLLHEGESQLPNETYAHNTALFCRDGIFAAAALEEWDQVGRLATALERALGKGMPEWCAYHVSLGRALARAAHDPTGDEAVAQVERLRGQARHLGLLLDDLALTDTLEHLWANRRFRLRPLVDFIPQIQEPR